MRGVISNIAIQIQLRALYPCVPLGEQCRLKIRPVDLLRINGSGVHVAIILAAKPTPAESNQSKNLKFSVRSSGTRVAAALHALERCG